MKKESHEESKKSDVSESDLKKTDSSMEKDSNNELAPSMTPTELYKFATTGNISAFEDTEHSIFDQVSPGGNTILHLAARSGHDKLVDLILRQCPDLIMRKNGKGDIALHVAASGGHLAIVKSLVLSSQRLVASTSSDRVAGETEVNKRGNTALHLALENRHHEVVKFLVEADPTVAFRQNKEGKSPLYMAAEAGYKEVVQLMMASDNANEELEGKLVQGTKKTKKGKSLLVHLDRLKGKSLLHAAIIGGNRDVLDAIWSNDPTLINSIDKEGRTPLAFAAYKGYLDGVCYLLDKSTDATYHRDLNGFFPIHIASGMGHIEIVQEFIKRCPDSIELLDRHGRNILHVAAKFGKAKVVNYMLKTRELEMLINERDDEQGNTPLHLATMSWHPKVVSILTWDKRVRLEVVNDDGLTAMDVAKRDIEMNMAPFRQRLTMVALKSASAPESGRWRTKRPNLFSSTDSNDKEQFKERVNTLLLVSTLVATVTFAAGFTMPGGYRSSGEANEGMATLVKNHTFPAFLICNTIAMYSAIIAAVTLIFAQLSDINLIRSALQLALPLLGVALTMMSLAFMAGVYLVVSNLNWLAHVVLILGLIFLITLLALFIPLYSPLSSSHYIARYIFYYPFCLMILATRSDFDVAEKKIQDDDLNLSDTEKNGYGIKAHETEKYSEFGPVMASLNGKKK